MCILYIYFTFKTHNNIVLNKIVGAYFENSLVEKEELNSIILKKLRSDMACKAAVKAGEELSREKIESMLSQLSETSGGFACPHGRPTSWTISLNEIERKFRRK